MFQRIRFISTLLFLLTCMAGLVVVVRGMLSAPGQKLLASMEWGMVLDGRFTAKVDRAVIGFLPTSKSLSGFIDGALYAAIGDAGAQVRAGCPDWLYLAEELIEFPGAQDHLSARAMLARKINAELVSRGIRLIVLPVPDKAMLVPEGHCGLPVSDMTESRPARWAKSAALLRLNQVDLVKGWPKPGFWRTDTHWDRQGAAFAAKRTAEDLSRLIGVGDEEIVLERAAQALDRVGDLTRLANLEYSAELFGPRPDREVVETASVKRTGGLLDETPGPQVLLAGSSYSLNSGFIDYLQVEARREIVQKSRAGGGFAGALLDILNADPGLLNEIKVIIWEWPMRSLDQPLTDDEKRYLKGSS